MEKRRKQSKETITFDNIQKKIHEASSDKLLALDLSNLNISEIPQSILSLHLLEHLYLKGNLIETLPIDFFTKLRSLVWLDLRCNKLQHIPVSVGQHKCLKTLLLGDNKLEYIPAELGLVKSLTGLNIGNNPLIDPPPNVVKKGIYEVKKYFLIKLDINETSKKIETDSDEDSSDEDIMNTKVETRKISTKEKWKNNNLELRRSYSEDGIRRSKEVPPPQCYSATLPQSFDGTCNVNGPHSAGTPCWFVHRPWTTGIFFTKRNNSET